MKLMDLLSGTYSAEVNIGCHVVWPVQMLSQ